MNTKNQHECDALLLKSALQITGDHSYAIQSAARVGRIAESLLVYSGESKVAMLDAFISASQEPQK